MLWSHRSWDIFSRLPQRGRIGTDLAGRKSIMPCDWRSSKKPLRQNRASHSLPESQLLTWGNFLRDVYIFTQLMDYYHLWKKVQFHTLIYFILYCHHLALSREWCSEGMGNRTGKFWQRAWGSLHICLCGPPFVLMEHLSKGSRLSEYSMRASGIQLQKKRLEL